MPREEQPQPGGGGGDQQQGLKSGRRSPPDYYRRKGWGIGSESSGKILIPCGVMSNKGSSKSHYFVFFFKFATIFLFQLGFAKQPRFLPLNLGTDR